MFYSSVRETNLLFCATRLNMIMFKLKQTIVVEMSNEVYHIVNTFLLYHFP